MDTIVYVVLSVIIIYIIYKISRYLKAMLVALCNLLELLCTIVSFPLSLLADRLSIPIGNGFSRLAEKVPTAKLSYRFPAIGNPSSVLVFCICLIYIFVSYLVMLIFPASTTGFDGIFYNTTVGTLINIFLNGIPFDWIDMLGAGFTSFLSYIFISKLLENDDDVCTFAGYVYHIVFFVTAILLSSQCSGLFDILGNWGVNTFHSLSDIYNALNFGFWGVVQMIGIGLALLALLYIGLNLFLVTLRDLIANIGYGILAFLFVVGGYFLLTLILPDSWLNGHVSDGFAYLLIIGTFIYAEHTRANPEFGTATDEELNDHSDDLI